MTRDLRDYWALMHICGGHGDASRPWPSMWGVWPAGGHKLSVCQSSLQLPRLTFLGMACVNQHGTALQAPFIPELPARLSGFSVWFFCVYNLHPCLLFYGSSPQKEWNCRNSMALTISSVKSSLGNSHRGKLKKTNSQIYVWEKFVRKYIAYR